MGVRIGSVFVEGQAPSLPADSNTHIVYTSGLLVPAADNAVVQLFGFLSITAGTSCVSLTIYVTRGPLINSPFVNRGAWTIVTTGGTQYMFSFAMLDLPGSGVVQYSLCVAQGAPALGSVIADGCLMAYVL